MSIVQMANCRGLVKEKIFRPIAQNLSKCSNQMKNVIDRLHWIIFTAFMSVKIDLVL